MEPLGQWCRANNEAYQGIFIIDEHHLGAGNEENEKSDLNLRIGTGSGPKKWVMSLAGSTGLSPRTSYVGTALGQITLFSTCNNLDSTRSILFNFMSMY